MTVWGGTEGSAHGRIAMMVHGGAGDIPDEDVEGHRQGCHGAAKAGYACLRDGGSAEDAVEAAVRVMENDPVFDAGRGSYLALDGSLSMDAALMEGRHLALGAVAGIADMANPISLARLVMESDHAFLIGQGASQFGVQRGLQRISPEELITPAERERIARHNSACTQGDTVGALALDSTGHLAIGLSTGGRALKIPGRVGDVPCAGAGFYVDDAIGSVVCSGEGEQILRVLLAKCALDALEDGASPARAARSAVEYMHRRVDGRGGLIVLTPSGQVGWAFNTPRMSRAWLHPGQEAPTVKVDAQD